METHKVHSIRRVGLVKKLSARKEYKGMWQGGYESLVSYLERYDAALKMYIDQGNPQIDDMDQAMDFFDGLYNGWYAQFKADIHNAMTSKMMANPPADVNTVYNIACNWVKTQSAQKQGTSTTFVMTLDKPTTKTLNAGKARGRESKCRRTR
jgi:hypothetical protein